MGGEGGGSEYRQSPRPLFFLTLFPLFLSLPLFLLLFLYCILTNLCAFFNALLLPGAA